MAFHGKTGDRVRLVAMPKDPDPIPVGTLGTVIDTQHIPWGADSYTQVSVKWDNGRSLNCVVPPDFLAIIDE